MAKQKARVAILGTGSIGTHHLIRVLRSDALECALFVESTLRSDGMQKGSQLPAGVSMPVAATIERTMQWQAERLGAARGLRDSASTR